jgi:hypothetical protein
MKIENYQFPKPYYPKPHSYSVGYEFGDGAPSQEQSKVSEDQAKTVVQYETKQPSCKTFEELEEKVGVAVEKLKDPQYLPRLDEVMVLSQSSDYPYYQLTDQELLRASKFHKQLKNFLDDRESDHGLIGPSAIFEIFTQEYIEHFSQYLQQRVEKYFSQTGEPVIILEVCAGNGRFSHLLSEDVKSSNPALSGKYRVIASDSGDWKLDDSLYPVQKMNHQESLEEFQPTIVVCSWMPQGIDFTKDFRQCASVQEYILIGDIEVCGELGYDDNYQYVEDKGTYCSHEKEGFMNDSLSNLEKWQFSRADVWWGPEMIDSDDFISRSRTLRYSREV